MVFPIIVATKQCGVIGNAYTSWTLGVPEHQLSTYQEYYSATPFNAADLGCPHLGDSTNSRPPSKHLVNLTGPARSSTRRRSSLDRDSASFARFEFFQAQERSHGVLSSTSTVVPRASHGSYASLVASMAGLSSSPASRIPVTGCGSLRWIAAGLMFLVLLY